MEQLSQWNWYRNGRIVVSQVSLEIKMEEDEQWDRDSHGKIYVAFRR